MVSTNNEQLNAIVGATMIDGTGAPPRKATVTVRGERIEAVSAEGVLHPPPEARVIDARGKYLLPGLIDSHVHLVHSGYNPRPTKGSWVAYMTTIAYRNLRVALQAGTTTVRGVCDPEHADIALRTAVERGVLLAPRIYCAGKGICITGGHGAGEAYPVAHEVDSPQAVRAAVREEVKAGADLIKLLTSHRTDHPEFSQEEIDAGVDEAHRLGRKVAIHAANFIGTRMSAIAGVDTIEHGSFVDEETADLMAQKGITLVPTLLVKHDCVDLAIKYLEEPDKFPWGDETELQLTYSWFKGCVDRLPKTIEICRARGVRIAAGTDYVMTLKPWNLMPEEIEWLTRYGLSNMEAIVSATRVGAEVLGKSEELGTIEPGKYADLIMVDRDPLADITVVKEVSWVMKQGVVVPFSPEWARVAVKERVPMR